MNGGVRRREIPRAEGIPRVSAPVLLRTSPHLTLLSRPVPGTSHRFTAMASSGEGEKKGDWLPWKRNSIKKSGEHKKSGTAAGDERQSLTETYPKTSQETRQPDRRSKKGSSSSRASAGSIESPPPSCARRSLVLESSDAAPATVGREGGGKPGSSPSGGGETVFAEDSRQEGTVGEYLFNDDPHREKVRRDSAYTLPIGLYLSMYVYYNASSPSFGNNSGAFTPIARVQHHTNEDSCMKANIGLPIRVMCAVE